MRRLALILVVVAAGCHPPGYGDDDEPSVDAAPGGPDAGPGSDGSMPDATPTTADAAACTAGFTLSGHATATSVWLSGDFVAWAATPADGALELVRGTDDVWRVNHGFAPGSYQYKFIIDGSQWIPDPGNADTVPDGLGGVNSVFTCP